MFKHQKVQKSSKTLKKTSKFKKVQKSNNLKINIQKIGYLVKNVEQNL